MEAKEIIVQVIGGHSQGPPLACIAQDDMQGSPLAAISVGSHAGLLVHRAAALIQVRVTPEGHIHLHNVSMLGCL